MTQVRIRERHSRWVRWSHWLNVPFLMIMIWSGLLIYWANPQYIPFPQWLAKPLRMDYRLAEGMGWHFAVMWPFALNGFIYGLYLAFSGEWKEIVPNRSSVREAAQVVAHDLHLRRELPAQSGKLNGAQRFAYSGALLLGFFAVVTGVAILKPVQGSWLTELLGGYAWARFEHFICMCGLVVFTFVHLAQVARAGWKNLRTMIAGYEVVETETDSRET